VCRGFDLSLTFGKYPEAFQDTLRAVSFRRGGVDKSSDKSSAESEVPKWKPLKKKLKLSVPQDKES